MFFPTFAYAFIVFKLHVELVHNRLQFAMEYSSAGSYDNKIILSLFLSPIIELDYLYLLRSGIWKEIKMIDQSPAFNLRKLTGLQISSTIICRVLKSTILIISLSLSLYLTFCTATPDLNQSTSKLLH